MLIGDIFNFYSSDFRQKKILSFSSFSVFFHFSSSTLYLKYSNFTHIGNFILLNSCTPCLNCSSFMCIGDILNINSSTTNQNAPVLLAQENSSILAPSLLVKNTPVLYVIVDTLSFSSSPAYLLRMLQFESLAPIKNTPVLHEHASSSISATPTHNQGSSNSA